MTTSTGRGMVASTASSGRPDFGQTEAAGYLGVALPDLSAEFGPARRGTEFRIGARILFVTSPGEQADALEQGTGDGFALVLRPRERDRFERDTLFEFILERSSHKEVDTGRAAEYWRVCAGFRQAKEGSDRSEPFMSMGVTYNRIDVSGGDLFIEGVGVYGGAGVEAMLGSAASAVVEAKLHRFWGTGAMAAGSVAVVVAAGLGLRF